MSELYPRLLSLTLQAKQYDIGINIDAEEADRLEISLDLLEKLCFEPELAGWNGIGFVIQAYQKRCPLVIDYIIDLARRSRRRLMIRLVKGAYWDSEIKRAQMDGLEDYPVYTRKVYTDVSYLACAKKLLASPNYIYPQFATHNAHTLSAIYHLAGQNYYPGQYEFQCLHGMGEPLYAQVVGKIADGKLGRPCRIYAPVGTHETLLAYLVRRLLENGANTSFVNRIADTTISLDELVADPVKEINKIAQAEGQIGLSHPKIPLPMQLYGDERKNSPGIDMSNEHRLASLSSALLTSAMEKIHSHPLIGGECNSAEEVIAPQSILNPANHTDVVGTVRETTAAEANFALDIAQENGEIWFATPPAERAAFLVRTAELMEQQMGPLMGVLVREAGKTYSNAIAEVREAIDFLYYYSAQVANDFDNNTHRPLGPVVCISPWNFPLAIFSGQIAAALAAGNTVLAKPAEQTPLIAFKAVELFYQAGVPRSALQLLPGQGETIGAQLVADERVRGVMFTGSTEVAHILQKTLAGRLDSEGRPVPLIAETGGLNAMIVDSSALTEQVVTDVMASAYDSAGQRCSALRILCIQEEVADSTIEMLKGAMAQAIIGDPSLLSTDIGPVIDKEAKAGIEKHIQTMRTAGFDVYQATYNQLTKQAENNSTFVPPTLIELDKISSLKKEIFGPVLHVVRYSSQDLPALLAEINATGYGLTMGVHTRIDETIAYVATHAKVGNLYVNRNMVGAVVGVQPFGGEGLSGTGPKAGGPAYLYRLLSKRPENAITQTLARQDETLPLDASMRQKLLQTYHHYMTWLANKTEPAHYQALEEYANASQAGTLRVLPGPTGERNTYQLVPCGKVLCLSDNEQDIFTQLAGVFASGCHAIVHNAVFSQKTYRELPDMIRKAITLTDNWQDESLSINAVIYHGDSDQLKETCQQIAQRKGAIISVQGFSRGETALLLERLLHERALSVNTAAAGGNASLMTIS